MPIGMPAIVTCCPMRLWQATMANDRMPEATDGKGRQSDAGGGRWWRSAIVLGNRRRQ